MINALIRFSISQRLLVLLMVLIMAAPDSTVLSICRLMRCLM